VQVGRSFRSRIARLGYEQATTSKTRTRWIAKVLGGVRRR
jgi:hypothetical protein